MNHLTTARVARGVSSVHASAQPHPDRIETRLLSPRSATALLLACCAALVAAGCASGDVRPGADADASAARPQGSDDSSSSKSGWLRFACDSGRPVEARYAADGQTVQVRRDGREHLMTIMRSASGARYADAMLEWWTKGSGAGATGMLLAHRSDGSPGKLLDSCVQQ